MHKFLGARFLMLGFRELMWVKSVVRIRLLYFLTWRVLLVPFSFCSFLSLKSLIFIKHYIISPWRCSPHRNFLLILLSFSLLTTRLMFLIDLASFLVLRNLALKMQIILEYFCGWFALFLITVFLATLLDDLNRLKIISAKGAWELEIFVSTLVILFKAGNTFMLFLAQIML